MTLHRRILTFYTSTLVLAIAIITFWSWFEFREQRNIVLDEGVEAVKRESPFVEALEILAVGGIPALLIVIIGGHWLMNRALSPIGHLTDELENTDATNLSRPVARTGNGDELDRMAAVFNDMKTRLEASFTQAREFTLHASHELKTPLTILHGTMEQMLTEPSLPPAQQERIASMLEEVQRLSVVVGQLAFLAKADAGQLENASANVPLHELVRELSEDLSLLSSASGITVTVERNEPVQVRGERMRLRQLLLALGDNAVKYNVEGGSIAVSLCREGVQACFQITNTGPVLRPELRARVFDRFFRGDASHNHAVEGSGLGLSIAQSIAKAHHGFLDFEVLSDDRTRVTLRLPADDKGFI